MALGSLHVQCRMQNPHDFCFRSYWNSGRNLPKLSCMTMHVMLMNLLSTGRVQFFFLQVSKQFEPSMYFFSVFFSFMLNREPSFFKDTHFVIDKFHYKNHRACCRGYNSSLFKDAAVLNSQVCEQFNKTLKKISISAQYSNASSYFLLVTSFMLMQNYRRIWDFHNR